MIPYFNCYGDVEVGQVHMEKRTSSAAYPFRFTKIWAFAELDIIGRW